MNQLDATATPMNIFRSEADLRPYQAVLPEVSLDNLTNPPPRDAATAYWMRRTEAELTRPDGKARAVLNTGRYVVLRLDAADMPAWLAICFGL